MMRYLKRKAVVLYRFYQSLRYSLWCFHLLTKGQLPKYEILMLAHRLEKGLLVKDSKPFWGWEKAYRMATLLSVNNDEFSNRTGRGVLKAYIETKKNSDIASEKEKAICFERDNPDIVKEKTLGGFISLNKEDVIIPQIDVVEKLFDSRHSCRDYKDEIVSKEKVISAIALALKCPSACNRQVTMCYIYQSSELQTIILTTNIRAYEIGDFNDWLISPSIFAGYLSLSLHLYGIGSCIFRKQLYGHDAYNEEMRKKCNIPNDEMIVLELHFGYYKDEFIVPVSNRHAVEEIISFVEE